jgi:hypothetical protein
VQGKPWGRGRVKTRFILYHAGRVEFLYRYWQLPYFYACGRSGCECAQMPAKDVAGRIIDREAWERARAVILPPVPRRTSRELAEAETDATPDDHAG